MKLTTEQRAAVESDVTTYVEACPGSGKTRCVAAKLIREREGVREVPRRTACITHTNAAAYEIADRVAEYSSEPVENWCDVSTIHAFCLNNILGRYYSWLPEYQREFAVLPEDSDEYGELAELVIKEFGLDRSSKENFGLIRHDAKGNPITPWNISVSAAKRFWSLLRENGYVDFSGIVYNSYRLLSTWPRIAEALGRRLAWVVVDEFQDTSELQICILREIWKVGRTRLFLVGDLKQSIYGFAGARPDLVSGFVKEVEAECRYPLSTNFRCGEPIRADAERLLPRKPEMVTGGDAKHWGVQSKYVHCSSAAEAVLDFFLPMCARENIAVGRAAVLAPTWFKLFGLAPNLREAGVPIVGPGARPYKRSHIVASVLEQICQAASDPRPRRIRMVQKETYTVVLSLTGEGRDELLGWPGRVVALRVVEATRQVAADAWGGKEWLAEAARVVAESLEETDFINSRQTNELQMSAADMVDDMSARGVDVDSLTVEDMGLFASPEESLHLITLHRAKGREFDAVAIVDLHEGVLPHFTARTTEEMAEARRLLYVGITRSRKLLLYATDKQLFRGRPRPISQFLGNGGLGVA